MTHVNLPANLSVGNVTIHQRNGLFSLNDLHRASGGEAKHQPSNFIRLETSQALTAEISNSSDVRNYIPTETTRGRYASTYACRELVIAYAAWISAAFHLKVIRVFLDTVAPAQPVPLLPADTQRELQDLVARLESANHHAVEQANETSARMLRANESMTQAHGLSMRAAYAIAQQVFTATIDDHADIFKDRWVLTLGHDASTITPKVIRIPRDAYILPPARLVGELQSGNLGVNLSNQELSQVAQAALERIAQRAASRNQTTATVSLTA